jgi:hypothetical protein
MVATTSSQPAVRALRARSSTAEFTVAAVGICSAAPTVCASDRESCRCAARAHAEARFGPLCRSRTHDTDKIAIGGSPLRTWASADRWRNGPSRRPGGPGAGGELVTRRPSEPATPAHTLPGQPDGWTISKVTPSSCASSADSRGPGASGNRPGSDRGGHARTAPVPIRALRLHPRDGTANPDSGRCCAALPVESNLGDQVARRVTSWSNSGGIVMRRVDRVRCSQPQCAAMPPRPAALVAVPSRPTAGVGAWASRVRAARVLGFLRTPARTLARVSTVQAPSATDVGLAAVRGVGWRITPESRVRLARCRLRRCQAAA